MRRLVYWVSNSMVNSGIILAEEQEIYNFGVECTILKVIHYTSYLAIAVFMQRPLELLVMACAFLPLRKCAGGYHSKTRTGCYFISCFTVFMVLTLYGLDRKEFIVWMIWLISFLLIFGLAPIDNENKPMTKQESIFYKKKSRVFVILLSIAIAISLVTEHEMLGKALVLGMAVSAGYLLIGGIQLWRNKKIKDK